MKNIFSSICVLCACMLIGCGDGPVKTIVLQPGQVCVSNSDTIYSLAKAHDISVRQLVEANHLKSPYILEEGQVVTIPSHPVASETAPADDDLDVMASGPVTLAEDAWKDVSLEGETTEFSGGENIMHTPVLPVPEDPTHDVVSEEHVIAQHSKEGVLPQEQKKKQVFEEVLEPKSSVRDERSSKKSKNVVRKHSKFLPPVSGEMHEISGKQTASFSVQKQEEAVACQDGVVVYAGKCGQFHKDPSLVNKSFVFVSHENMKGGKWTSVYLGVKPLVSKGQKVKQGDALGACQGSTLQFQLRKDRIPVAPKSYFK